MVFTIKMTGLHCKQIGQVIYDKAVSPFDRKSYKIRFGIRIYGSEILRPAVAESPLGSHRSVIAIRVVPVTLLLLISAKYITNGCFYQCFQDNSQALLQASAPQRIEI